MKRWIMAAGAGLLGLLWLAACGPKGPAGTEVTVHLVAPFGGTGTGRVVYQVGDGGWQVALPKEEGGYAFTVPAGEKRYGVAVNCFPPGTGLATLGFVRVYQLTTDEATELRVGCMGIVDYAQYALTSAQLKATAASGDRGYNRVWLRSAWSDEQAALGSAETLYFLAEADRDLLLVAYSDTTTKYAPGFIERIRFVRDFDASSPPVCATPCEYELNATDEPAYKEVDGFSLPDWAHDDPWFGVGFVSKNGLVVPHGSNDPDHNPALGTGDDAGGSYQLIPGTEDGDVYWAEASSRDATGTYRAGNVRVLGHEGEDLAFALPAEQFDPSVEEDALPRFSWSGPPAPDLIGYAFVAEFPEFNEFALVSTGWLEDRTEYQVPDLSGAPGFHGARPFEGETLNWEAIAIVANEPLGEILAGEPLPLPNPLPRLPGLDLKMASKKGSYVVP